jgi:hypothetical protein
MARFVRLFVIAFVAVGVVSLVFYSPFAATVAAQQPTGSIPTVTGTPSGAIIAVYQDLPYVEVYSGPSMYLYPAIGVLLGEQEAPVLGISEDSTWLQIYYPGVPDAVAWVYAPYVRYVKLGDIPIVEAPPTPTPASTPTIDPTLAAAFIAPQTPTRLPTFTEPAPLVIATFVDEVSNTGRMPMGLLILGLGFIGSLGAFISFLRAR